uniref:Myosin motor domain-containing protein n=1 Tax=Angiostrongylus cantonensis TaxID=6313 RepID=A0A0K0CUJ5_ANGCA
MAVLLNSPLQTPRRSRLRQHRDLREDEAFLVRHYAGTVCYQTAQFLDKNNDTLQNSLEFLVEQSRFDIRILSLLSITMWQLCCRIVSASSSSIAALRQVMICSEKCGYSSFLSHQSRGY